MKRVLLLYLAVLVTTYSALSPGQSYPAKPVRIVVPLVPGGNLDIVTRAVAQRLGEGLGQQVIVENRPGASSLVGTQFVAKSAPDGYTLLSMANTFAVVPSLVANPGYDPLKDFTAVSQTCLVPQVFVVNPALPARSLKELIALAKTRPGEITYGTSGTGGTGHMATELLARQAGIKLLHVPYKGNAQALVDVMGGQVMMMPDQVSTSVAHVNAGKLRALAVTSLKRSPLFPGVPTVDEAGVRGYEDITFNGLVAPAGTPREILARLHAEVGKVVAAADLRSRFIQQGVELTASASPEAFMEYIRVEFAKKAKLARDAGIRIE
jgi:tripartite-type tricarboxylate transporter receptor subunit TctC